MEEAPYRYSALIKRDKITWPNNARLAVYIALNIEHYHFKQTTKKSKTGNLQPDLQNYTMWDYGNRVGFFRILEALDKYGMRASVLIDSSACENLPIILEEGKKRNWEWLGHGVTNPVRMSDYAPEEERNVIKQVKEIITKVTGKTPKGWLGPAGDESFNTLEYLAAEGFEYTCDWGFDDQPFPMRVKSGRMIAMPYRQGISDLWIFKLWNQPPERYYQQVCDQFDTFYKEGAKSGMVMAIPIHTYTVALPTRIKYFDKALEYICSHDGVWLTTSGEITDWYYQKYYDAHKKIYL